MQDSSRPTHSIYQALSIYLYSCSISGSGMTWRTESLWLPYGGVTERAKILFSDQCYLQFDTPTKMSCFANPPLNLQATCQEVSTKSEKEFLLWSFLPCGCMWYQFRAIFSAGRAGGQPLHVFWAVMPHIAVVRAPAAAGAAGEPAADCTSQKPRAVRLYPLPGDSRERHQ